MPLNSQIVMSMIDHHHSAYFPFDKTNGRLTKHNFAEKIKKGLARAKERDH